MAKIVFLSTLFEFSCRSANSVATSVCSSEGPEGDASPSCLQQYHEQAPHKLSFERLGTALLREAPVVRDRISIPDSHSLWMPSVIEGAKEDFPAVFRYTADSQREASPEDLLNTPPPEESALNFQILLDRELARYGAVVVKGLPIASASDFSKLMHATNMTLVDYVGGVTSRPNVAAKVTPASEEPAQVSMEPHMDNPYWPIPPARLILYVGRPPPTGGQALLSDSRAALRHLREEFPEVLAELERRSVRYKHFYPDRNAFGGTVITSWQDSLAKGCVSEEGCNATDMAEEVMHAKGFEFEWVADGLQRWEIINPVRRHPVTGEETWANMLTAMHCSVFDNHPEYLELNRDPEERSEPCSMHGAMPYHTTYGDGSNIPVETMHAVRKAQWAAAVSFDYEVGDVLAIDNFHAMHGRFSFEPPRELYLTMVGR